MIAVGIEHRIIDSQLYKEWFRGSYVDYWQAAQPLVRELRLVHKSARLFVKFEKLARAWEVEIRDDLDS